MNKIVPIVILLIFINVVAGYGQETKAFVIPDSLATIDYAEINDRFRKENRNNESASRFYANVYLQKAKNEKDFLEIAKGYGLFTIFYNKYDPYDKVLVYLDSAIVTSKQVEHKRYPALFYINKGQVYEGRGNFKEALDQYLVAIQWCKKFNNDHLEFITKHNIALLKRKLGKYEEAKAIFKESLSYRIAKEDMSLLDSLNHLVSLSGLVNTHRLMGQLDSAHILNKKGIIFSKGKNIAYSFKLNEAILQYYDKKYKAVIEDTNVLLPELVKPTSNYFFDNTDLINVYLYQGRSYSALNDKYGSVNCYKKVDSILEQANYVTPETRITYTNLINHYKSEGDRAQQLFYINKLLYSDSILDSNYKYLSDKLIKDYDEALEAKNSSSSLIAIIFGILTGVALIFLGIFYKRQKTYQKRFKELIEKSDQKPEVKTNIQEKTEGSQKSIGISQDIVNDILSHLEKFEQKQGFIKGNITTTILAHQFKTNSKYLSKVINTYKEKSFIQYINDLRIEYVIAQLKISSKFRNYTIKALASESGFNTTEAFSKSFYRYTGIHPSYFIKQLEKNKIEAVSEG